MFPRQLSEKVFSFQDGQPSLAFSIWMHLGEAGNLTDCGVTCSRVVATRMTYAELNQRLEAAAAADRDMLQLSKVSTTVCLEPPIPLTVTKHPIASTPRTVEHPLFLLQLKHQGFSNLFRQHVDLGLSNYILVVLLLVSQAKKHLLE